MGVDLTPAMKQYLEIKARHPDCILLCRMGDFYELFFEDAVMAARELDITLTSRNKNREDAVPLAGFPYHAAASYIGKLIAKGYKVAVCEQTEDPKTAKGLVKRELVRIVTPGLPIGAEGLVTSDNVFLAALCSHEAHSSWGAAFIDISTGEFYVSAAPDIETLLSELGGVNIRELIIPPQAPPHTSWDVLFPPRENILVNRMAEEYFSYPDAQRAIGAFFSGREIQSLDLFRYAAVTSAVGAVVKYLQETQMTGLSHINRLRWYERDAHLSLDETAKRNLELFSSLMTTDRDTSLLSFLDHTVTPMGKRMFRHWLTYPLKDAVRINDRLDAVAAWGENHLLRGSLRRYLKGIHDLQRLCARIAMKTSSARDLIALRDSLACLPELKSLLADLPSLLILAADRAIDPLADVLDMISLTIVDSPPAEIGAGGTIREGCDPELDELNALIRDSVAGIAALEEGERKRTGIGSLKIGFNNVFGYYIEISRSRNAKLPEDYVRKQTLVNAERYITRELKFYEEKVLVARERIKEIEKEVLGNLLEKLADCINRIQTTAENIALLDVLAALAEVASRHNYCRPSVNNGLAIDIRDGRHPVVERMPLSEKFVPNDLFMNGDDGRLLVITGPNMAGKSTYIRQAALIVIMAQIGSFVPAKSACIGVVDKIFTRLGAMDSLSRGQSTFMVEMIEVANVLKNATTRSLIILDEVGRGTGTFDGIAIAWAVAEYIHDSKHLQCRTLFATHYHQLTELALTKKGVKNYNIAVRDSGGEIIFLRKILPGATNRSYGIQVARLAGLPVDVISRAGEILENMEKRELDETGQPAIARRKKVRKVEELSLFGQE